MQPLEFFFKLPQYLLQNDTKTVELVDSPTISIPNKYPFSLIRVGKLDNTLFTMTLENLFDTTHTIR